MLSSRVVLRSFVVLLSLAVVLPCVRASRAAALDVLWSQGADPFPVILRWPAGDRIYTSGGVWRASDGRLLQALPSRATVFSPDGQTYARINGDNVDVHRSSDGQLVHTLTGHEGSVRCVTFSSDGQTIATGSSDSTIKLWRASDGAFITTFFNQVGGLPYQVAFSPSGALLAATYGNTVAVRAVPSGQVIGSFEGLASVAPVFCMGESAIATCSRYWDGSTSRYVDHVIISRVSDGKSLWSLNDHTSSITQLSATGDGATLISSSDDGTIKFWDLNTGKLVNTVESPGYGISSFALSPDEQEILSGGSNGALLLWKAAPPTARLMLSGHEGAVAGVTVSPDGRKIATASWDSTVKIWDAASGQVVTTLQGHVSEVYACAFSPDSQLLATAGYDGIVRVWRTVNWQLQNALEGHTEAVLAVAFSADGQRLASAGWDRTVKLWRVSDGQLQRTITGHTGEIYSIAFSPDGQKLASASYDNSVRVWDVSNPAVSDSYSVSGPRAVAFTPDGAVVAGSADGTVRVGLTWPGFTLPAQVGGVGSLVVSPDGKHLYAAGFEGRIGKWRLTDRQYMGPLSGHTGPVTSIALDRAGRTLVSGSWDNEARVWQLGDAFIRGFPHNGGVTAVGFGPDDRTVLTCSEDSRLLRWDAYNGLLLGGGPQAHDGSVTALALSADRALIVTGGSDGKARLWRQQDLSPVIAIPAHTGVVNAVALSPDAATVVTAGADRLVKLWDRNTGALLKTFTGHTAAVNALAITPNGQYLASGGADNFIKVWRLSDRTLYRTLTGHAAAVSNVAFSGDGLSLASGSSDGILKLWKTATWQISSTQSVHPSAITALSFTPDSSAIVTAGQDMAVRFWRVSDGISLGDFTRESVVSDLQFSSDGAFVALGHSDASVAVALNPLSPPLLGNRLKLFEDGNQLSAAGLVVSRVFPGFFYAQQADRSNGIRIEGAGTVAEGDVIDISGTLSTSAEGERFVQPSTLSVTGNAPARPLWMTLSALGGEAFAVSPGFTAGQVGVTGGTGLNNIGLLVKVFGKVTFVDPGGQFFTLCGGSAVKDADGHDGVRVSAPGLTLPGIGDFATVTGISSCYKAGEVLFPLVRVRSGADVQTQ